MLNMYITGLTHALRLLHLVAKLRKHAEIRLLPPPAVKLRELKLKRESEQTRACTHKLGRPTPALEHPTDDKFCWSGGGNSHRLSKPSFIFSM